MSSDSKAVSLRLNWSPSSMVLFTVWIYAYKIFNLQHELQFLILNMEVYNLFAFQL
jgi:hypothetical protein